MQLEDEKYMQRCLQIAKNGFGNVAPNPMVGCVIVNNGKIISEGYHQQYGKAHAEVNAIQNLTDKNLLENATVYVNLEPCAHYGKTPPCANLLASYPIKKVVIGCIDVFSEVNGAGISILKNKGIEVVTDVLEKECLEINKRFFTYHNKKRPYIILRWAQSLDGYIGKQNIPNYKISNTQSQVYNHKWRSEEQAILVGTNTAIIDNPSLSTRLVYGKNPLRFVIDLNDKLPANLKMLNDDLPTYIFSHSNKRDTQTTKYLHISDKENCLKEVLQYLYTLNIQSLIVEGGNNTLQNFIDANFWDEARVFESLQTLNEGIIAPKLKDIILQEELITEKETSNKNTLRYYKNITQKSNI